MRAIHRRSAVTGLLALLATFAATADDGPPTFAGFGQLEGVYEPSAAEQLPDGRIFVVEDESETSLVILAPRSDGTFEVRRLDPQAELAIVEEETPAAVPDDFEAIAVDEEGFVYASTSHSRDGEGLSHPRREQLVRFKVDGDHLREVSSYGSLKGDIAARHPLLAASVDVEDVKNGGGFNVEAIAFDAKKEKLLVGFRSPRADGRAVIVTIENPKEMFEPSARARIGSELVLLDLASGGVRGMAWIPELDGYLIISGPARRDQTIDFGLWHWSGDPSDDPRRVRIPGPREAIDRSEGVAPILVDGQKRLLLIRDDGKRKKEKGAHYILIGYDQIEIGG